MDISLVAPPADVDTHLGARRLPSRPPCLDYDPADYEIRPCTRCDVWWAEIVRDPTGRQVVREWHAQDCPLLMEWE